MSAIDLEMLLKSPKILVTLFGNSGLTRHSPSRPSPSLGTQPYYEAPGDVWVKNFLHILSKKFFLKTLSVVKGSITDFHYSSRYQTICTVDGIINFKIYLQSSSPAIVADRGKKGNRKMQKFEYQENEENFLGEIKAFDNFLRAIIWRKKAK